MSEQNMPIGLIPPNEHQVLTADTITDEQIRELRAAAQADDWRTRREADYALYADDWQVRASGRRSCAEIINARGFRP